MGFRLPYAGASAEEEEILVCVDINTVTSERNYFVMNSRHFIFLK